MAIKQVCIRTTSRHPTLSYAALECRSFLASTTPLEFVDDPALKHRIHEERKFLDDIAGENLEPYEEIIKVSAGDLHFWTMMDVMKEPQLEHHEF